MKRTQLANHTAVSMLIKAPFADVKSCKGKGSCYRQQPLQDCFQEFMPGLDCARQR